VKDDRVVLVRQPSSTVSYCRERSGKSAESAGPRRFILRSSREMVFVMSIIVIIILLATPHFVTARKCAMAARIVCDFNAIATATMAVYSENGELPPNDSWGKVPDGLVPYLPAGFEFQHNGVSYRWRRWCLPSGLPERPEQRTLLGVQVRTEDERMLNEVVNVYRGRISQLKENQITLVIL
jgi:hypothetical protein